MGFFDKLRKAIDSATESFTNNNSSNSINLQEIVADILASVDQLRKKDIQKIIKVKHNVDCDDAVLDKILSKISGKLSGSGEFWYYLTSEEREKEWKRNKGSHVYNENEIRDICYADFREEMRLKFNNMLEAIKADISGDEVVYAYTSLEKGIPKITKDFPYRQLRTYNQRLITAQVISDEIIKLFFDKDQFIKDYVIMCVLKRLRDKYNQHAKKMILSYYIPHLYNFAIRAMHFESHFDDFEDTSITKAECYDAVAASKYYQKQLAEKSQNEEAFYNSEASIILNIDVLSEGDQNNWCYWATKNMRFVDAACFEAFQFISEEYYPSSSVEETVLITNDHLTKYVKVQED